MEIVNWIYDNFDTFAGIFALVAHLLVLVLWMMHYVKKKLKNGNHPESGDCNIKSKRSFTQ